jgi:hypothetical protein
MTKNKLLFIALISLINVSCVEPYYGEDPLPEGNAGASGKKNSKDKTISSATSGNGGFSGFAGKNTGGGGVASGNSGSSGKSGMGGSPVKNTGGNSGSSGSNQSFGGSSAEEVGGYPGIDYSIYCSKDIPFQAEIGKNENGYEAYRFKNPTAHAYYCNPICGIDASKDTMYLFDGVEPPSPIYGKCVVVQLIGKDAFYACCDTVVCKTYSNYCFYENNNQGDLYICPDGDHELPNKNCQVRISNASYDKLVYGDVDIGYSEFCCPK